MCVSAANLSARPGGAADQPFVRATSLLHSHFCTAENLQEAIIRSVRRGVGGFSRLSWPLQQKSGVGAGSVTVSCLSSRPQRAPERVFCSSSLQERQRRCVRDPQRGPGDLLPAAWGFSEELGHPQPPGQRLHAARQGPTQTAEARHQPALTGGTAWRAAMKRMAPLRLTLDVPHALSFLNIPASII